MKANPNGAPSIEKESEDEILSKRNFETDSGVNLDKFLIKSVVEEEAPKEADETQEKEIDVAVGEVAAGVGIIIGGLVNNNIGTLITRLSGGAVVVIMIGAILIAHSDWLITKKLFMSEQIFLLILGLYFAIKGNN